MKFVYVALTLIELAVIARVFLRPHRSPSSRAAWAIVIAVFPIVGILAYCLLGETSIGLKRVARARAVLAEMPPIAGALEEHAQRLKPSFPEHCAPLFRLGQTINGFAPVGGNTAHLTADSNAAIDAIVADMDAAENHIHLLFYIWLRDHNGLKVVRALERAAARGVACRAMVDGLGSRLMIRSAEWRGMEKAGVQVAVAQPLGNHLLRPLSGRIDLRNHRKIVVIDDRITYCGSQNCADPEFLPKRKFAPWVDALMRFEGPIARQNQHVFIGDWMTYVDEDLQAMLSSPIRASTSGFAAQVIATGPTLRSSAMPEVFETLMHAARRELVITTPYYVPGESTQAALCAAAHRGVETTLVVPARNDSWEVGAASRSYYLDLLEAGVRIHEYVGGLLHTKSITADSALTLIGSANMDRRSSDLNAENNILFYDEKLTAEMQARQETYIRASREVRLAEVEAWSMGRRLWNNMVGMVGPLL